MNSKRPQPTKIEVINSLAITVINTFKDEEAMNAWKDRFKEEPLDLSNELDLTISIVREILNAPNFELSKFHTQNSSENKDLH